MALCLLLARVMPLLMFDLLREVLVCGSGRASFFSLVALHSVFCRPRVGLTAQRERFISVPVDWLTRRCWCCVLKVLTAGRDDPDALADLLAEDVMIYAPIFGPLKKKEVGGDTDEADHFWPPADT